MVHSSLLDLPIGFRFVPRNEELIRILRQRQQNVFYNHPINQVNVYDSNPQQLSENFEKGNDKDEWFFMTERIKVCKGGKNQKRGNNEGYWDARTQAERIDAGNGLIGYMRQLVYKAGKKPNCVQTDWRMNEYWFESCNGNDDKVDSALCKIFVTPRATKKKSNKAVENEVHHDALAEYQAPDQIMPQYDQYEQATWSPFLSLDSQGQIIVNFEPNPPDVFVEDVEYQEPQIVPHSLMMVQEGEQQQEQQQVTQSPLLPFQDPQDQDPGLWMDTEAQINNINNVPYDVDFWNMSSDKWRNSSDERGWNSSEDQFLNT